MAWVSSSSWLTMAFEMSLKRGKDTNYDDRVATMDKEILAGLQVLAKSNPQLARSLLKHTVRATASESRETLEEPRDETRTTERDEDTSVTARKLDSSLKTDSSRKSAKQKKGLLSRFKKDRTSKNKSQKALELNGPVTTYQSKKPSKKSQSNTLVDAKENKAKAKALNKPPKQETADTEGKTIEKSQPLISETIAGFQAVGDKINTFFSNDQAKKEKEEEQESATKETKTNEKASTKQSASKENAEEEQEEDSLVASSSSGSFSEDSKSIYLTTDDESYESSSMSSRETVSLAGRAGPLSFSPKMNGGNGNPAGDVSPIKTPPGNMYVVPLTRRPSLSLPKQGPTSSISPRLPASPTSPGMHAQPHSPRTYASSASPQVHKRPPVSPSGHVARLSPNAAIPMKRRPSLTGQPVVPSPMRRIPSYLGQRRDDESVQASVASRRSRLSRISRSSRVSRFSHVSRTSRLSRNQTVIVKKDSWELTHPVVPLDRSFDDELSGVFNIDHAHRGDTFDEMEMAGPCCCW